MKTLTLAIIGAHKYWYHPGLIGILCKRTGWNEQTTRNYFSKNQDIAFYKLEPEMIRQTLDALEKEGFLISLLEGSGIIRASISFSNQDTLSQIKVQMDEALQSIDSRLKELTTQINQLSVNQNTAEPRVSIKASPIYQSLIEVPKLAVPSQAEKRDSMSSTAPVVPKSELESTLKRRTTEEDIGKYWLSKIGIFTLLLGVVFLITYTSQFLGALGKLAIGVVAGAVLAGLGNFLSTKEKYHKWAMSAIGGGWAILYFTIFAAYHVPMVKVINNPFIGFILMLAVAGAFIYQSLKFESRALAFMSYFLAFFATTSTEISVYTLVATYLLGISAVIVNRKLGWGWLALLCLTAIYGIHWMWLEPSIYGAKEVFTSDQRLWDLVISPWMGDSWQVYPILVGAKSFLHLSFLVLYWILFTALAVLRDKKKNDDTLISTITIANGLIFVCSFIHHLHLYYPHTKWIFALVMGVLYLFLSVVEQKRKETNQSDINLVFSVALFCLLIPMYFDGASVTYGWSAASASLIWLGLRHNRFVLRVMGWILAALVSVRLFCFDYLDRTEVFHGMVSINPFFFVALFASLAWFLIYRLYDRTQLLKHDDKISASNIALIISAITLGSAFVMGGMQTIASMALAWIGIYLVWIGCEKQRVMIQYTGITFVVFATLRFLGVDFEHSLSSGGSAWVRHIGGALSIAGLLGLGEWIRNFQKKCLINSWYFPSSAIIATLLLVTLVSDELTKSFLTLMWGATAFCFIGFGFKQKEKIYRWIGLSTFVLVLIRLFMYDFAQLQVIYKIISFIGLGTVFIVASFIYNYYSKMFLVEEKSPGTI